MVGMMLDSWPAGRWSLVSYLLHRQAREHINRGCREMIGQIISVIRLAVGCVCTFLRLERRFSSVAERSRSMGFEGRHDALPLSSSDLLHACGSGGGPGGIFVQWGVSVHDVLNWLRLLCFEARYKDDPQSHPVGGPSSCIS